MAERGSATLLLPTGLLLMLVLGATAVDLSHLRTARAELQRRADAAANDAVTAGLDLDALRAGRGYRLDPARARRAAVRAATGPTPGGLDDVRVDVAVHGARTVRVRLTATVGPVFAAALPGAPDHATVRVEARARTEVR